MLFRNKMLNPRINLPCQATVETLKDISNTYATLDTGVPLSRNKVRALKRMSSHNLTMKADDLPTSSSEK